jgi:hypothetical protein
VPVQPLLPPGPPLHAPGSPHGRRDGNGHRPQPHVPHLPDIDQSVQAFLWAVVLGFVSWLFLMGIGSSLAFSTVNCALASVGSFFAVRVFGEEPPTRPRRGKR